LRKFTDGKRKQEIVMNLNRLLFGIGLALVLPGQALHAQQSDADRQALAQLRAEAEKGDAQSQFEMGKTFSLGKFGVATNYMEAVKWIRKAAEQNYVNAQYNLGVCYHDGLGLTTNYVEAVAWFRKAAEQNQAEAQFNLGVCYRNGQGVAKDDMEAVKWYRRAAEQNHARAQFNLGRRIYYEVKGGATNDVEAVKWWRKAAAQNDAPAQNGLGLCYDDGVGVPKDKEQAVQWFRKAAEQGLSPAQYNLGAHYSQGEGLAKDMAEAVRWWRKAAHQNNADAQYNLGVCYNDGLGVEKDEVQAYKWWLLAGAQGNEVAKKNITLLERQLTRAQLAEGQKRAGDFKPPAVPSLDPQQGEADGNLLAELRARAGAGEAPAQNELGEALYAGKQGATRNPVEAVKWFRQAANQNHPAAQSNLGVCYERGDGVAKYEVEAYKWYLLAAAQGDNKAKRNTTMLELLLLPEQMAEGKRRAQAWLEQRNTTSLRAR
jgi:TPR repeat protein